MAAVAHVRAGAAWHTLTKWSLYTSAAWVEIKRVAIFSDNGDGTSSWKNVYVKSGYVPGPTPAPTPTPTPTSDPVNLNVKATPTSISGVLKANSGICQTSNVLVGVTNGNDASPPYTFTFTLGNYNSPNTPVIHATTAINGLNAGAYLTLVMDGPAPQTFNTVLKCSVKDTKGNVGNVTIPVTFISTLRTRYWPTFP